MRIAFVTIEYPPNIRGGAGEHAEKLTAALARRGHDVTVLTPGDQTTVIAPRLIVRGVPSGTSVLRFWSGLRNAIEALEPHPDVVHVNGLSYGYARRLTNLPVVLTVHHCVRDAARASGMSLLRRAAMPGSEEGPLMSAIERRAVRGSDKVIAISRFTKGRIAELYGVPLDTIDVVPNGRASWPSVADTSPLDISRPMILFVGRLDDRRKGFDVLLKAFPQVAEATDATLIAVGRGDPAGWMRGLSSSLSSRIKFMGFIPSERLAGLYLQAELCIVPSRMEGYGLTVAEAMQAGRAVVASNVGAIPEILRDESQMVEPDNSGQLAQRIIGLLEDNTARRALELRNKKIGEALPTWDEVAAATEEIYSSIVQSGPQVRR